MRCAWHLAVVVSVSTVPLGAALPQAPSRENIAAKLGPCQVPGVDGDARCGTYAVPESRAPGSARKISLNVVVLPATTDSVASDPLVFLAGGGVVPATRYAGFLTRAFPALRRARDVLLVDQRGTWGSNPLACNPPAPADPTAPPGGSAAVSVVRACRDSLALRADLRAYTTPEAVEDLEAVRAWLGYTSVSLYGVSYGTKVAQVYLRMHPERVRAAVLYGVVPVSLPSQLELARSAQASLERVFWLCGEDAQCHSAFPLVATEFDSLLHRLTARRAVAVLNRPDGSSQTVVITDRAVRDLVQGMLGSARAIERLPLLLHLAYSGDYTSIARALVGGGPPPPPGPPRGVFLSLICSEAIPQFGAADVEPATRGTFFGDAPVRSQMQLCAEWPRATLPDNFWEPVHARVPVLALSGDLDPITPPRYAEMVVRNIGDARHIVLANRSHNDVDPCITSLFEQFLMAGSAAGLDTRCVDAGAPLRFETAPRAP